MKIASRTALEALDRALPEPQPIGDTKGSDFGHSSNGSPGNVNAAQTGNGSDALDAIDLVFRMLPEVWRDRIGAPLPPDADRSRMFARIIGFLRTKHPEVGLEVIEALFERFPEGPASKYKGRLRAEIDRLWYKKGRSQAHQQEEQAARGDKPVVRLITGMIAEKLDEAEQHLLNNGYKDLYQRGDYIALPALEQIKLANGELTKRPGVVRLTPLRLREIWTKVVDFQVWSAEKGQYVSVNCPHEIARHYLDRVRSWRLPHLAANINTPFLRADGSLVQTPGYDRESGVLYDPMDTRYPPVPEKPDREDALRALEVLKIPFADFPFVPDEPFDGKTELDDRLEPKSASRSVALSNVLTALRRPTLPTSPLHGFNAPQAATGKSKLAHITSIVACGYPAAAFSPGLGEEEFEKRLAGELLSGAQIILLDNCEDVLAGMLLAQCLSEPWVKVRVLRTNDNPVIPNTALINATGNNLQLGGDLPRRSLRCDLDAKMALPELREFAEDAVDIARQMRPELVIAGLTILRGYELVREATGPLSQPLGGFVHWSRAVRDALIWLGESDPVKTQANIRRADPDLTALGAVMAQWERHLGLSSAYTVTQVILRAVGEAGGYEENRQASLGFGGNVGKERVEGVADLREVLLTVAGRNGVINGRALGLWLGRVADRVVAGRRFSKAGIIHGLQYWQLFAVKANGEVVA